MQWFTSDTHFNHENIIRLCNRPFENVRQMNRIILDNFNAVVGPKDEVYHLGDFGSINSGSLTDSIDILSKMNGKKHLIVGNHDKHLLKNQQFRDHFEWIRDLHMFRYAKCKIVLCHYPLLEWEQQYRGSWHLYGHVHNSMKEPDNTLCMNVGVDTNMFMPISFEQVKNRMEYKTSKLSLDK